MDFVRRVASRRRSDLAVEPLAVPGNCSWSFGTLRAEYVGIADFVGTGIVGDLNPSATMARRNRFG
jgi:hypothetical protein